MPIFKLTKDALHALPETAFHAHGVKERSDLQRLLRANIGVVAADVLIIAEEFSEWDNSKRRIDLLGVDRAGNLVVIELKRDDDGGHMELQAVRYAAMVSTMTFARAVEVFSAFLLKTGGNGTVDVGYPRARDRLLEFLGWDEPREDEFARDVRIVLVAADFSKELTTAVLWLNERDLDIRCVRLKPYTSGAEIIIDAQQVVPLPEAEEYTIQIKQKEEAARLEGNDRHSLRRAFWSEFLPKAGKATPRFAGRTPGTVHYVAAPAGINGLRYVYCVWQNQSGVEFYIDRDDGTGTFNKAVFDSLTGRKAEIEKTYGKPLGWERLDDKRACRLYDDTVPCGLRSPRDQWRTAFEGMIDAMQRLERAIGPHLQAAVQAAESKV
ncbi:MAG: DUF4268 domain-containing protein [Phycisphaerales bacterium]